MLKGVFGNIKLFSFIMLAGGLLFPAIAYAEASESATVNYNVTVRSSLTLTLPSSGIAMALDPAAKTFDSDSFDVVVGTNNEAGYTLTLSTPNDSTDLIRTSSGADDTINAVIPTVPASQEGYTDSTLPANNWGFKISANTSKPSLVTTNWTNFTSGITLMESSEPVNDDTATLNFASKIDYDQPYGTYNTTLNFALVANPLITCDTTITGNMQDFDPCPDIAIGTSGTLTDARDSKNYTVAKLADGNWWMTKNLNLAGGTKLYSETSDVPDGYPTSGGTGYYTLPTSSASGFSDNNAAYVYNTGNETSSQTSSASNSYYSWLAATAGGKDASGTAVTGDGYSAPYSICPKGWKLPSATTEGVSRDNNGYTGGDFYKMITKYMGTGVTTLNQGYYDDTNPNPFNTNAGPGTTPNFLLAGYYYYNSSYYGGSRGYYWSSSSRSSTSAYILRFYSSYVYSAANNDRGYGFPVRCLLR